MARFRLLAIDIDGTLVNSRDELTAATRVALARAAEAGICVVLATGRRYSRTLPLVEPLGVDLPLVTASGALVKDPQSHATFFRAEFDHAVLRATVQLTSQCGFDPVLCSDTFADGFDYYQASPRAATPELAEYFDLNPDSGRVWPGLIESPPADAFMAFTMGTHRQMLDLEAALHEALPGQLHTHVLRSPRYRGHLCEIAPAGVTKWSAVERLARHRNIGAQAICAVGDDVNDLAMIEAAGLGVAMGNAQPEVKAAADRIAPGHDEDGLVAVVDWLLSDATPDARATTDLTNN